MTGFFKNGASQWLGWLAVVTASFAAISGQARAQASLPATLKANPTPSGAQITLGDIFNNAGPAATTPLARAPRAGQRVVFGAPSLQARANAAGLRWANGEGVREVVVVGASQGNATAPPPSSQVASVATLAVLNRAIARGDKIEAQDVVWMDAPNTAPRDALSDPEALIGKTAKRALQPSTPLRAADVMDTPAVKRGEPVTLVFEASGMRLSVRGRAMADGAAGAMIKVLNPQSNKTLDAVVEGPGLARVMTSRTSGRLVAQIGSN